jgi:serine/threonine-protein kinase
MDYLTGESLADILRRENHIGVDRCFKTFTCVTDALEHAHHMGVLHRDLKSSNIMLVNTESQKDVVKVVDFGIAKILPQSGKQAQNLTATGEIFGSPIYMSPEQCQGLPLDTRSDIYSTGVMMYEALTGEPPLMGENIVDTMQMHVTTMPVQFAQIRPDLYIPANLEAIVFKALDKRPENRFQSMAEFKEALEYAEKTGTSAPERVPMKPVARSTRSTRQNLTGSRPPSSLPKPMLDTNSQKSFPDLGLSGKTSDLRQSSARNPEVSAAANRGATTQGAKVTSFKVDELQKFDKEAKRKKVIIIAAIVMLVLAIIIAIALFFVLKH